MAKDVQVSRVPKAPAARATRCWLRRIVRISAKPTSRTEVLAPMGELATMASMGHWTPPAPPRNPAWATIWKPEAAAAARARPTVEQVMARQSPGSSCSRNTNRKMTPPAAASDRPLAAALDATTALSQLTRCASKAMSCRLQVPGASVRTVNENEPDIT